MTAEKQRDAYRVDLKCPHCGLRGVAEVSEEDYPFTENRRFSVDEVTPGFTVRKTGSVVTEMQIICSECNVSARPIEPATVSAFEPAMPRALQADQTFARRETAWLFRASMTVSLRVK